MKTELLFPSATRPHWREQFASLEDSARKLEATLTESLQQEDVVHAVARLSVPDLADHCTVFVVEGDKCVRRAFSHRSPKITAAVETFLDQGAELNEFAEGRRALAGESLLFQFSGMTACQPALDTPAMAEIVRRLAPTSVLLVPFVVLDATIAVASFNRSAESGLTHGPQELALAQEMARRAVIRHAGFAAPRFTASEDPRLRRVDGFIRDNLASSFSLAAIAREAGLSRFHLLRLFKQAYGETPFKRLTRLRMEEAQRRLARSKESVTEIAFACGYKDSAHFASAFRRAFGVSPRAFRRLSR